MLKGVCTCELVENISGSYNGLAFSSQIHGIQEFHAGHIPIKPPGVPDKYSM